MTRAEPAPVAPAGSLEELEAHMEILRARAHVGLLERCAALERHVGAIGQGTTGPRHHRDAIAEAHRIVGTAGTFGFPRGSGLAREIEEVLLGHEPTSVPDRGRLTALVRQLRDALGPSAASDGGATSDGTDEQPGTVT